MTALADLRTRVLLVLADPTPAIWTTDDIDEALKQALEEYSHAAPWNTKPPWSCPPIVEKSPSTISPA